MDYDIIVIGGGPAGLSAAVRAAWVAAPAATYRARILVIDAGDAPGGLSRWQPLVMNTPGTVFTKRELKALLTSAEMFGVEFRQARVKALRPGADGFEVHTDTGVHRTLAAVIAVGSRLGHPEEHRLFHHNRMLWFSDLATLDHQVAQLEANPGISHVCLCGSEAVTATRAYLSRPRRLEIVTCAEPPYTAPLPAGVLGARLDSIAANAAQTRLVLRFVAEDGAVTTLESDVLLLDFNAYQKRATSLDLLGGALRRQPDGYLDVGRDMRCETAGLFCAGDATGAPFGVAKAMSEGTLAGFAAYDYVCRARTGRAPNLFPFYPFEL